MNKLDFALGWFIGLLLQLPVILIFKLYWWWYLIQVFGLLIWFIFYFFSTCKIVKK
jgi:hypothetical protein